ncbi:MAG: DEAD/DEAH box helicase [Phycisphaerales bacterium]|nr:DEAD/DEAH box helicase [Phycisphaerales bacterium]
MLEPIEQWFARNGWTPFDFQRETWAAYRRGESGLVHAPTGTGKTYAVWLGPLAEWLHEQSSGAAEFPSPSGKGVGGEGKSGTATIEPNGPHPQPFSQREKGVEFPSLSGRGVRGEGKSGKLTIEPGGPHTQPFSQREKGVRPKTLRGRWITPLRALANDSAENLRAAVEALDIPWTIELRTGDTPQSIRQRQRKQLPPALITTPESLSVMLSYSGSSDHFKNLRCIIVDEWHELLGTKRGVQTELGLARLRWLSPKVRTWGLSATLGNLDQAMRVLLGYQNGGIGVSPVPERQRCQGTLICGDLPKRTTVQTLQPDDVDLFPWSGHLGLKLLHQVISSIEAARTTLLFTNVRSQAEIWFQQIIKARPDLIGHVALHHGSIDRDIRKQVEDLLRAGRIRCVVCTSSLDLGVDFLPVDQVMQLGSPKGIARMMQRAGRSGHQPGAESRILGVPTNALELIEFAAAREAVSPSPSGRGVRGEGKCGKGAIEPNGPHPQPFSQREKGVQSPSPSGRGVRGEGRLHSKFPDSIRTHPDQALTPALSQREREESPSHWAPHSIDVESRTPLDRPLDVLVQHLVTLACGDGFTAEELQSEIRSTFAFHKLTRSEWQWALDFVTQGGPALHAYPQYARVIRGGGDGRYTVASLQIERMHRMMIGTITSDAMVKVAFVSGATLGMMEESFISRLHPGDRFVFAGRVVELVRVHNMTAHVKKAKQASGIMPRWNGSRCPLSTLMAAAIRRKIDEARRGIYESSEMRLVRPLMELQSAWSIIPQPDELLIERTRSRDGHHVFIYPFDGRQVHEGLSSLVAHRIASQEARSMHITANDYGFELLSGDPIELDEDEWRQVFTTTNLVEDMLGCLNTTALARRAFRDIARVAGLIFPGFPGQNKTARQFQASSNLFYEVFSEFDPQNLLLDQAKREVLDRELEVTRLRQTLDRIGQSRIRIINTQTLTPLGFPIWAESIRTQHITSESWADRVRRMVVVLEKEAAMTKENSPQRSQRKHRKASSIVR